mmetsp:Transcript_53132/g.151401  ORF Transcript_53132/g.151401 Transcript_53132/m.151401 type:complete len:620 (+) Transcript_53132:89-1948(+)
MAEPEQRQIALLLERQCDAGDMESGSEAELLHVMRNGASSGSGFLHRMVRSRRWKVGSACALIVAGCGLLASLRTGPTPPLRRVRPGRSVGLDSQAVKAVGAKAAQTVKANTCEPDEERLGVLCYKKCSLLTNGYYPIRTSAMTCCSSHPCGFFNQKHDIGFCSGFSVAGGNSGACPHSPGGCAENEEFYLGQCYKRCSLLTENLYPHRVAPATCCKKDSEFACFIPTSGNSLTRIAFDADGTGKKPHAPRKSVVLGSTTTTTLSATTSITTDTSTGTLAPTKSVNVSAHDLSGTSDKAWEDASSVAVVQPGTTAALPKPAEPWTATETASTTTASSTSTVTDTATETSTTFSVTTTTVTLTATSSTTKTPSTTYTASTTTETKSTTTKAAPTTTKTQSTTKTATPTMTSSALVTTVTTSATRNTTSTLEATTSKSVTVVTTAATTATTLTHTGTTTTAITATREIKAGTITTTTNTVSTTTHTATATTVTPHVPRWAASILENVDTTTTAPSEKTTTTTTPTTTTAATATTTGTTTTPAAETSTTEGSPKNTTVPAWLQKIVREQQNEEAEETTRMASTKAKYEKTTETTTTKEPPPMPDWAKGYFANSSNASKQEKA